ncbi:pisatin demethylase [Podospora didyma]|uniref:Pisatin demethylase n=1 Tax=Podospora didyma TaxID=330526 RepID=A0AAE0K6M4_9PEZI|nr:pisatin demethylase [Podospora didyma]
MRVVIGLFVALEVAFIISTYRQWLRLRHIRGPPFAGLSTWLWAVAHSLSGQMPTQLQQVNNKYGSIARIGPNMLVTSDWKLWKHITHISSRYNKSEWFAGLRLSPTRDNVVSMIDKEEHARLRDIMDRGYSKSMLNELESKIDDHINSLLNLIESSYQRPNLPFDFARTAMLFTLDAISDVTFSSPFGFLKSNSDCFRLMETIEEQVPKITVLTNFPRFYNILKRPLPSWLVPSPKDKAGMGAFMGVAEKVVAERYGPEQKDIRDILGSFITNGLTQEEAQSEILVQILASSDSTATAIRAIVLLVATNPPVLRHLLKEIDDAVNTLCGSFISYKDTQNLEYLCAVVREGLRLWPPSTGLVPREVPPEGDEWNGVRLPGGANIGWNIWGALRDRDLWGHDADEFRPGRWLEYNTEKLKEMQAMAELVFGNGNHVCLGRTLALMTIHKTIFELFDQFTFVVVNPDQPWESKGYGMFLQKNFWIRAYNRPPRPPRRQASEH